MLSRCDHCEDVGRQGAVRCLKGRFGGLPHMGVCRARCPECRESAARPSVRRRLASRRRLLAFAAARQRICEQCELHACAVKRLSRCERTARLRRPQMICPASPPKWGPVNADKDELLTV